MIISWSIRIEKKGLIMQYTIFQTPVIGSFFRLLSRVCLKAMGWRVTGQLPSLPKYVIIAAYHTSNWDFVIGIFAAFVLKARIYWIGKDNLFKPPFVKLFRWIGGIPINRSRSQNMVDRIIQIFHEHEHMIIALAPKGTRRKTSYWKTGFYHIAAGAGVPMVLAFIDYRSRTCGIGPVLNPTGDMEADMEKIRSFYSGITGKYPGMMTPPVIDPDKCRKTCALSVHRLRA